MFINLLLKKNIVFIKVTFVFNVEYNNFFCWQILGMSSATECVIQSEFNDPLSLIITTSMFIKNIYMRAFFIKL